MLEYFEYRNTIKWSGNKDNFPLTLMLAISSPTIYPKHIILEANFVRASKGALVRNIERENLFSTQFDKFMANICILSILELQFRCEGIDTRTCIDELVRIET